MHTINIPHFVTSLSLGILLICILSVTTKADEIAIWNFNDSDLVIDHGTGTMSCNFNITNILFAAGTTNNARLGDVAGQALSLQGGTGNGNNGRNLTVNVDTAGFANIVVSFATQGTSTGFNSNQFQYSVDGVNFIDFGSPYIPATAFGSVPVIFTLTSIVGLNNNPNAAFRIVFNGASTSTGNNRLDNFVVEGSSTTVTTVPEPSTMLLLVTSLGGLLGWKCKKRVGAR